MPKQDAANSYFLKLNKTLNNFEQRIGRLESRVQNLSSSKSSGNETEQVFESPPKRRLGWGLIWLSVFFFIAPWILRDLFYFIPLSYSIRSLLAVGSLIAGIVLILSNPKSGKVVEVERRRDVDIGQDALLRPSERKIAREDFQQAKVPSISSKSQKKSKEKSNLESDIGKKWLPRIGVVSIVLGVAFFIIYAIQNKWIGPAGQVALGVLIGLCMILAGEFFYRKEYLGYSMSLTGGGFAIVYFAIFAANKFYSLINVYVDIFFLSLVIMGAVVFSVKRNSMIIASEAFLLGYIVPLLTSHVNTFFLVYSIALTAGLAVLVSIKQWKILGAAGMVAMYITHIFWLEFYQGNNQDILHVMFLVIYFAIFAYMAVKTKDSVKEEEFDSWVSSKNVFGAVLIATYFMLFFLSFDKSAVVIFSLVLLLLTAGFFVMNFKWDSFIILGMAGTYMIHARWLEQNISPGSILINFIAVSLYFLLFNALIYGLKYSKRKTQNVISILANSFLYYAFVMWPMVQFQMNLKGIFTAGLAVFYLIMAYLTYGKKINHFFNAYIILCLGYLALTIPLQFNREWITISWAAITLMMVILSFKLEDNVVRICSTVIGGFTLGKLLFMDSWMLGAINVANFGESTRLFAFAAVIIVFYVIAWLYFREKDEFENYEGYMKYVNGSYAIAATGLTTLLIALEIWDTNLVLNAKKLWTSLSFIIQAIVILSVGFSAKIKLFRIMGLVLFGLAILKVFLYDLSSLETGYRIISFIVLGVIALAGAYLYNRFKEHL